MSIEDDKRDEAEGLAKINFDTAIDQADDYDSVRAAIDAYHDNAIDSAHEHGQDVEMVNGFYADMIGAWEGSLDALS